MTLARRRRLRPISPKRAARGATEAARVAEEGPAFRQAIKGKPCAACGRTEAEAYRETGYGHHAHHAVRAEVLHRLRLENLLWSPRLAVPLCEEPCHRRHTSRHQRLRLDQVPVEVVEFCREQGLQRELARECGG